MRGRVPPSGIGRAVHPLVISEPRQHCLEKNCRLGKVCGRYRGAVGCVSDAGSALQQRELRCDVASASETPPTKVSDDERALGIGFPNAELAIALVELNSHVR